MINTVLGSISESALGATLMHEHILVNLIGADFAKKTYNPKEVVDYVLPYLIDVRNKGCSTIVEATPKGLGRDIEVLKQCSEKSGLNIITCTGAWDGGDVRGNSVPKEIREKTIDEIAAIWINEIENGIENTTTKPGFIKMALGDEGEIFPLQEKLLRAAIKTSLRTGLRIQCHVWLDKSMPPVVKILEEDKLPFDHFIWVHADASMNLPMIFENAKKGMWIQFDGIAYEETFEKYPPAIRKVIDEGFLNQLLFGQDSGSYHVKESPAKNNDQKMRPYATFYDRFIPYCIEQGIDPEIFNHVLHKNSIEALKLINVKK
ncbi:MAG: hypothetical protein JXA54_12920 [Candidatus Heimdallarchaeota archaeon]|nr:hypothetical protein [Candidatus Heimdallarchaeota archaeon]